MFAAGCRNLPDSRGSEGFQASAVELPACVRGGSLARQLYEGSRRAQHHGKRGEPCVQNLEDWLGVTLFQRGGGKLGLTEPGAAYAAALGEALKAVAEATARLPGRRSVSMSTPVSG